MLLQYGPHFFSTLSEKIWATCEIFLGKWFTAPPGKKFPVRLLVERKRAYVRLVMLQTIFVQKIVQYL